MHDHPIYLDYAAATPTARRVVDAMRPYWSGTFANPSSLHAQGRAAQAALESSRITIAKHLNCLPHEIIFTSGGTESINLVHTGVLTGSKKDHIITTNIEHAATVETCASLKKQASVTIVKADSNGLVSVKDVVKAITSTTRLVSIIYIQNEIGTIQPVHEIGKEILRLNRERAHTGQRPILFHIDASQAPAFLEINIAKLHCHLMTLDGSKMYGPKGIGLLYIQKDVDLKPILMGGGQQKGLRSGSEPTPLIAGLAEAFSYVAEMRSKHTYRISALRDYAISILQEHLPEAKVTGDRKERIANNIHVTFPNIEGEQIVLHLDTHGIATSTGSACSSAEGSESHIMKALKVPKDRIPGSLRVTLGYETKKRDIEHAMAKLIEVVQKLSK